MRKTIRIVFFASVLFCSRVSAWADSAIDLMKQADSAYSQREDLTQAKVALVSYERAAAYPSTRTGEAFWKAARTAWWLGENTTVHEEKLSYFQRAIDLAQQAVNHNSDSVEAHFWLGASQGVYGKAKGIFKSLTLINSVRHEMAQVIRLNDHYLNGAAYRVLGVVDFKVPTLMGGNLQRAKGELDKARSFGGPDPFLLFDDIQYYQVVKNGRAVQDSYAALRNLKVPPEMVPEHKMLLRKAEKLFN